MDGSLLNAIAFGVLAILIAIPFYLAKRYALTCKSCNSREVKRTGNCKNIERSRRSIIASPLPSKDFEYKCEKCGKTFWSSIEGFYELD